MICKLGFQNKLSLFSTFREPTVNKKDLQALTLVRPPRDSQELDPLAVKHLDNRLTIYHIIMQNIKFLILFYGTCILLLKFHF